MYLTALIFGAYYTLINDPKNEIYYSAVSVWEIGIKHSKSPENMPPHNEPFDRILIVQANTEGMIFLTYDHLLKDYDEDCIRTI